MSHEYWNNKDFQRDKARGRRARGEAGKGDKQRPTNQTAYHLGMQLIKVKEQHGADSKEYKQAEKAWRAAVKKGQ
jgi:hypothetical protein